MNIFNLALPFYFQIDVGNKKNNDTEYVVLDEPLETRAIRIQLQSGSNVKCLRLELYGCKEKRRRLEYQSKTLLLQLTLLF